jgi:hypothetical protein
MGKGAERRGPLYVVRESLFFRHNEGHLILLRACMGKGRWLISNRACCEGTVARIDSFQPVAVVLRDANAVELP